MIRQKNCQRQANLRRVLFWLRSCEEDAALECPGVMRRYLAKAREALDDLLADMFGEALEAEAAEEAAGREVEA